jgi:hypothetical protein
MSANGNWGDRLRGRKEELEVDSDGVERKELEAMN